MEAVDVSRRDIYTGFNLVGMYLNTGQGKGTVKTWPCPCGRLILPSYEENQNILLVLHRFTGFFSRVAHTELYTITVLQRFHIKALSDSFFSEDAAYCVFV